MSAPKFSVFFLLLVVLLSSMQESTSHLDNHVELERKSSEEKVSSMFIQSYSAILSSLKNSRKNRKFKQTLGLKVPSGPNRLHN